MDANFSFRFSGHGLFRSTVLAFNLLSMQCGLGLSVKSLLSDVKGDNCSSLLEREKHTSHLATTDHSEFECEYEKSLDALGVERKSSTGPQLRCDFVLQHRLHRTQTFADVRVTHPDRADASNSTTPLAAVERHWKSKRDKYLTYYNLAESAVQPLVFDVFGGYAARTHDFLRTTVQTIASGDERLFGTLWQRLRDRIAVALAKGHAEVIHYFNFLNGTPRVGSSQPEAVGPAPDVSMSEN